MKWSPTERSSHVWMMRPCLTEHGNWTHVHNSIRSDEIFAFALFVHICDGLLLMLKIFRRRWPRVRIRSSSRMPRWIPDDVDFGFSHAGKVEERLLRAPADAFMHRATGGGQRHHHDHFLAGDGDAVTKPRSTMLQPSSGSTTWRKVSRMASSVISFVVMLFLLWLMSAE